MSKKAGPRPAFLLILLHPTPIRGPGKAGRCPACQNLPEVDPVCKVKMGFLEVSVEMFRLSGASDYTGPQMFAWLLYLIAVLILVWHLKPPRKEDHLL
jgi:hypothetical protein